MKEVTIKLLIDDAGGMAVKLQEAEAAEDLLRTYVSEKVLRRIDEFDRVQLAYVLKVCASSKSLSDAGRQIFSESRKRKSSSNDADRIRKYLNKWGIDQAQFSSYRREG